MLLTACSKFKSRACIRASEYLVFFVFLGAASPLGFLSIRDLLFILCASRIWDPMKGYFGWKGWEGNAVVSLSLSVASSGVA